MKRFLLHFLFWFLYLCQDSLLAFLWDGGRLSEYSVIERIFIALEFCAALLPPKILFTYFVLYYLLPRILKHGRKISSIILYFFVSVVLTLFLGRIIEVFFVYPILVSDYFDMPPFFSPFGFLFAFIDLGYVAGIAIAIKQFRLQLAGKEREKLLIKEKLETELKYLRNQTNPHFLFNTLNNIYGLARKKSDDTAEVVMRLSKLLRFMIYETKNPFIKIGDEIKMLENFISLEKIRYTRKLTVNFRKSIDNEEEPITPLLLIPFVENAFKHGSGENRFETYINIEMELNQGNLLFFIENSKENNHTDEIKDSIGLGNVKRQLDLMYKEHVLAVKNEPHTFKVTLHVNLRNYANL